MKQTNGLYPAPLKILEVLRYVLQIRPRTHGFVKLLKRILCSFTYIVLITYVGSESYL